jgi:FkbM family methyltransferase
MGVQAQIAKSGIWLYRRTVKKIKPLRDLGNAAGSLVVSVISSAKDFEVVEDDPLWFRLELLTRAYESETVEIVRRIAKPGMTALDIGAHVGYYTRLLSKLAGDAGRVIAFEPHPRTVAKLRHNVRQLKNVTVERVAVTDKEGDDALYDVLPDSGGASLRYDPNQDGYMKERLAGRELAPRVMENLPMLSYVVKTVPLDSYLCQRNSERVDFIKMDIEGAEASAVRGMERTVGRSGPLRMIMEFNPAALRTFGADPLELWGTLRRLGFRVMVINGRHGLQPLSDSRVVGSLIQTLETRTRERINFLCEKTQAG